MSINEKGVLELRYVIRNGEKVLQQKKQRVIYRSTFYSRIEVWWEDVETVEEEEQENEENRD